jgi:hypothetical protein
VTQLAPGNPAKMPGCGGSLVVDSEQVVQA